MADALTTAAAAHWRKFYQVRQGGIVEIRGNPTQADFEAALHDLCQLKADLPRIIGNLLAHGESRWGQDYITGIMETFDRSRGTLYQYKSVYARLPVEQQRPAVKYSYDRQAARLPPAQQGAMLDRVEAGDFANSDEFAQAVRAQINEPTRPKTTKPRPIPCAICGGNGFDRERLNWYECPHCGTHGDELLDQYNRLLAAVKELYQTGVRDSLDAFVQPFKFQEAQ